MDWRFSYNLSRPFPFRFFTTFVVVLFVIATVLLSLFNTIVSGYELRISYSTNPNETQAVKLWYDRPGFGGIKKLEPRCESKELGQQQIFHTNKSGLLYTVNTVESIGANGNQTLPSLIYLNNPLENCSINFIRMEMEMASRTAQQVAWSRWGPSLQAAISCFTTSNIGLMRLNSTVQYDLVPAIAAKPNERAVWRNAAAYNLFRFIKGDNRNDTAMWWAESLMSYSWITAARAMEVANLYEMAETSARDWAIKGTLNFVPNATDISSPIFFSAIFYFLLDAGNFYGGAVNLTDDSTPVLQKMFVSADALAKAFYSTISADLGIVNGPNILANSTALKEAFSRFNQTDIDDNALVPGGPAVLNETVDAQAAELGTPEITTSTIFSSYLCQMPVAKVPASLIVSVLLADLVFLRALWTIVGLVAVWAAGRKDDTVNWCPGCLSANPPDEKPAEKPLLTEEWELRQRRSSAEVG